MSRPATRCVPVWMRRWDWERLKDAATARQMTPGEVVLAALEAWHATNPTQRRKSTDESGVRRYGWDRAVEEAVADQEERVSREWDARE
ncbi:MAG TPA: hypothetical protein VN838_12125 [Bradyrhizobium sp.]|nr:hypothetical protein [Bradyrhizobium sp.]